MRLRLDTVLDELICVINSDEYFKDIRVIKAYPFDVKPTRPPHPYIALGIEEIDMCSGSIDSAQRSGQLSVFADIFVSKKQDAQIIYEIFSKMCEALECFNVLSIKAFRIKYDADTQSNVFNCVITFNDELVFGGDYYK